MKDRVEYLIFPLEPARAKESLNARHVVAFRDGVLRYLYEEDGASLDVLGESGIPKLPGEEDTDTDNMDDPDSFTQQLTMDKPTKQPPKDKRIAFCHFHPRVIEFLLRERDQSMLKRNKWRIPISLGEEIGLLPQDMCPYPDSNGEPSYFALPNYSLEAAVADLVKAEQVHLLRLDDFKRTHPKLTERVASHPSKYAVEIQDLREQNALLTAEAQELKSKLKSEQNMRIKAEQRNKLLENRLCKTKGRLERAVETKKHAVPRGRPPKKSQLNPPEPTQQFTLPPLELPEWPDAQLLPLPLPQFPDNNPMLNTHDEKWEYRFNQLVDYHGQFGHCKVPRRWEVNKSLGKWVSLVV